MENALKILLPLFLAFFACSKPLIRQEGETMAQGAKEARTAQTFENSGSFESVKADSVIVVKFDTISRETVRVKYYGIDRVRTDTASRAEKVVELKTDTVWRETKVYEKNGPGFFERLKSMAMGFAIAAMALLGIFIFRRLK
jgi:hypothetical protein